jgi:hypothetical protein
MKPKDRTPERGLSAIFSLPAAEELGHTPPRSPTAAKKCDDHVNHAIPNKASRFIRTN